MNKLPIFEITIKEDDEYLGLSIVNNPAIGEKYIYFNEEVEFKMDFNEEQMIVKGPVLIPDKLIYRNDTLGERVVKTEEFKEKLERRTGLPVILWDERLTTVAADKAMMEAGIRREDRSSHVDKVAAVLILQGYLDWKSHQNAKEEQE